MDATLQSIELPVKRYTFNTDTVSYSVVEVKGEEENYVTGYISNSDVDVYNDLITEKALDSMLKQINSRTITLDYEHESWRDDDTILPVGKIVEAKKDSKGLWVKALLNKYSPKFKALWGSIKKGFVNSFSIAFKPRKMVEIMKGKKKIRKIDDLELLNVALTGNPVNKGAKITGHSMKSVMLKAIDDMSEGIDGMDNKQMPEDEDMMEDEDMVMIPRRILTKFMEVKPMVEEEEKTVEQPQEVDEEPTEEPVEKTEAEKPAETPAEKPAEESTVEEKAVLVQLKSMVEELEKVKSELKEFKEKAVFKSLAPEAPVTETEKISGTLALIS